MSVPISVRRIWAKSCSNWAIAFLEERSLHPWPLGAVVLETGASAAPADRGAGYWKSAVMRPGSPAWFSMTQPPQGEVLALSPRAAPYFGAGTMILPRHTLAGCRYSRIYRRRPAASSAEPKSLAHIANRLRTAGSIATLRKATTTKNVEIQARRA
jgi:hypothetical protein